MKTNEHPHEELIRQVREDFSEILASSPQGISIYLDDPHWTCNDKLATMLGYKSADEMIKVAVESSFLDALVSEESLKRVPETYFKAVNEKIGSVIPVTWKKKGGGTLKTQVIFAPISVHGNMMVMHFVTPT
ncbi:MAG TPA: hypothetical protein VHM28_07570 [Anaerolineales bacterium]|nr:hypothetical protein [Anaerolineales bacterium]